MSLFNRRNNNPTLNLDTKPAVISTTQTPINGDNDAMLANLALTYIGDGVAIVNSHGIIDLMNPAGAKLTGNLDGALTTGLELGLVLNLETSDGRRLEKAENPILKAIETNQPYRTKDLCFVPKDSQKRICLDISVIPTGEADADRILTFRDITKELDDERAQSEFISTASHEMRTPVASIEGYLGLALNPQTATIDERAKKYLESARAASQHLGKLFQDLLDVGKLDDKRIHPNMVPMELNDAVKKIVGRYEGDFKEKNLTFVYGDSSNKVLSHALSQPIYVMADENFLIEIVSNLMENAVKYSPNGGTISVNVVGETEKGMFSVSDTGVGIPHEDLSHIFQKFYRVDNSATREIGGTGLGLYIVKQRVESMNGIVTAESTYGKGSTFKVWLPRISSDEYEKQKVIMKNALAAKAAKEAQQISEVMSSVLAQTGTLGKEGMPEPPKVTGISGTQ